MFFNCVYNTIPYRQYTTNIVFNVVKFYPTEYRQYVTHLYIISRMSEK